MLANFKVQDILRFWMALFLCGGLPFHAYAADQSSCTDSGVALQILGSGGPIADDARASAGYLVWIDGKSRYLIDAGGGVFLRFAEAGGHFSDLNFIGISHFHADHSADLVALLKSGNFANRERDLPISGPAGKGPFPGLHDFLNSLLSNEAGAYAYLAGFLNGNGRLPLLEQIEVEPGLNGAIRILSYTDSDEHVDALYVPHGIVPALAYRIQVGDVSIVFASDQNGSSKQFVDFASNATVLVMHMPVPEGVTGAGRKLHAPPSVIGEIAAQAEVEQLVLSHFMARSLRDLDGNVSLIRSEFDGSVMTANDLDCIVIGN